MSTPRRVKYFYADEIGLHASLEAQRKPHTLRLADELIKACGLQQHMTMAAAGQQWSPLSARAMTKFHTDAYIKFLQQIELHGSEIVNEASNYALNASVCFSETAWPFSQLYAGASVAAAQSLAQSEAEVAINWSGGQTHARRDCASGHSYVNDVVLATLQLLTTFERVLIVNVDACHASGVEEAFYTTDRVMFLSAHVHRDGFFPGSGGAKDTGEGAGKHHTINLPMLDGAGDEDLHSLLLPVLEETLERYQPHAVVCCAGTSILAGDQLGCMNVSMSGHARCLQPLLAYKRPLLLLGGSGNTGAVSARAWANATALACQTELASEIPEHDFLSYYGPGFKLEVPSAVVESMNCEASLTAIREAAMQTLAQLPTYAKLPPPVPPPAPAAEPATGDATVDDNSPADGTHATKLENGAAPAPADDASAEEMAQAGSDAESKEAAEPDADAAETKTTPGEDDAEAMEVDEVADNAANGAAAESHPDAAADE